VAADAGTAADPGFDLPAALRALLDEGLLTGVALAPTSSADVQATPATQEGGSR
jgi:hypothetical protein